MFNNIPLST